MRKVLPWLFLLIAIVIIIEYTDVSKYSVQSLIFGFAVYSALSVITGLRLYIYINSQLPFNSIFTVPAAMNFAGYIFPFKGGGIWLLAHLKKAHGVKLLEGMSLALQTMTISISLIILLIANTYKEIGNTGKIMFLAITITTVSLIIGLFRKVGFKTIFSDVFLSIFYVILLSLIPYAISDISIAETIMFSAIIMTSSLIKITPGNIGILEGVAALASTYTSNSSFIELAVFFRLLSLIHAALIGFPSFYFLAKKQYIKQ